MGCGRSKQIQRNPRLVQPYDNNDFSNVIGGVENTSNENSNGVLIGCCRRKSGNISGEQNIMDISDVKPTVKHLRIAAEPTTENFICILHGKDQIIPGN